MKAIIWDLDGTLIDSYTAMSTSIYKALKDYNISYDLQYICDYIKRYSVVSFFDLVFREYKVEDKDTIVQKYVDYNKEQNLCIKPLPHAVEILDLLTKAGVKHYIYTHKSNIAHDILKNLNTHRYFTKILTIDDGFKRKPDPEAINYLVDTYSLDKNNIYYVGDRSLDIESAVNAEIKSILYIPDDSPVEPTGKEDYVIKDLLDVADII